MVFRTVCIEWVTPTPLEILISQTYSMLNKSLDEYKKHCLAPALIVAKAYVAAFAFLPLALQNNLLEHQLKQQQQK